MDSVKMQGLDLFSGIGGISKALEPWVRTIAYCEQDRFCQSVLLSRMETSDIDEAPIWDDVTTLTGDILPRIDIIFGGFPCQDISVAGAGKGLEGKRSGLVREIFRLIDETKPPFVFLENVSAIRLRGAETVSKELSKRGYDCRWCMLSASDVGALHKRERWFLLGYSKHNGISTSEILREKLDEREDGSKTKEKTWESEGASSIRTFNTDSVSFGQPKGSWEGIQFTQQKPRGSNISNLCEESSTSDTTSKNVQGHGMQMRHESPQPFPCLDYNTEQWQKAVSEICRTSDGVPNYVDSIKALGNSVVPKCVREAFKILIGD